MNFKKYLPYIVAIVTFVVITLIHFKPLLSGKSIRQADIVNYKGASKEITDFRTTENAEPLWTNSMFGGMPAYQISVKYPGNWLGNVDKVFKLGLPHPSGYVFLYFLGFFILLLCLGIDPWLAIVGSLAYGFSSYFFIIIEAGHNSKANAIGYLAPLLGGIILLVKNRYWLGFSVTALFMALELNANHVQISYYGFILFGFIFLAYLIQAVQQKELPSYFKALGFFVVAALIAILPNAGNLLTTKEYGDYTTRGKTELTISADKKSNSETITSGLDKDYATQWSYGIGETFTFLIPNYKGGGSSRISDVDKDVVKKVDPQLREQVAGGNAYYGDQPFTSGPVYIGAIVCFLAFLGLFIINHPIKWALFGATVLSIMLAWGKNFMGLTTLFMEVVPGYNKFRAVSMILVVAELTLPLLAILAVDRILKLGSGDAIINLPFLKKKVTLKNSVIAVIAVVGGFCLVSSIAPDLTNSFTANNEDAQLYQQYKQSGATEEQINQFLPEYISNLEIARKSIFQSDARRSLLFIALAGAFIILFLIKKIKKEVLLIALCLFIVADLWPVAFRYLNKDNFESKSANENPFYKTSADEEILKDPSLDYRVLNLSKNTFNDASTSYWHKSIGGYHGAKLKKYQEVVDFHLDKEINTFYSGINTVAGNDSLLTNLFGKLGVLNMLNTKYLIIPTGKEEPIAMPNPQANGNAWFVTTIKEVANADSEIVSLARLNTKSEAVIQQKNKEVVSVKPNYDGRGSIKLVAYKPNNLIYESEATTDEFAVFSEIYYPKGWNAYIDGKLVPHTCVNYILRGMNIPAGKHKIEFKFEPTTYSVGNKVATFGSILLLVIVFLTLFLEVKRYNKSNA